MGRWLALLSGDERDPYHPDQRALQDRFDDAHRDFIEARDAFFLATVDEQGWPQCSWKGGAPRSTVRSRLRIPPSTPAAPTPPPPREL
jgi:hypothetical protein